MFMHTSNVKCCVLTTWLQNWFTATWSAEGAIVFKLDGVSVCQQAWLICHGVSEHKYYKAKQTFFSQRLSTEVEVPTHSRNIAHMPGNSPKEALCLTWIHEYLEKTCDQVPNDNKLYLPVGITVNLIWQDYHAYCMSNNSILPSLPPYGQEHFRQLLQTHFPNVTKVRNCRLGKCDTCSQWKESRAQLSGSALEEARVLYCNHLKMQSCLRMLYLERSLESQSNPNKSWTIILDCAQSQPIVHRVSTCKTLLALKEHLPECGIAGLINHAFGTRELHFLDQNIPHDSSMIISLLWGHLLRTFKQHPNCFSDLLNVQLDNCWKDNKNQYMFAFLS
ncbi:hypothetical protein PROFUN_16955, partial [Planoprotostelium fungivorum]